MTTEATASFRFSLRGLLLCVTAISVVLGTYSLFEVVGLMLAIAGGGWIVYSIALKHDNTPFSVFGFIIGITATLLTCGSFVHWMIHGEGPIFLSMNWPTPLANMAKFSSAPGQIKARQESHYGSEFCWRMPITPERHAALVSSLELEEASRNDQPFGFERGFPRLWRPSPADNAVYHRTQVEGAGRYFTLYDPDRQLLFVRYSR